MEDFTGDIYEVVAQYDCENVQLETESLSEARLFAKKGERVIWVARYVNGKCVKRDRI